MTVTSVGRSLVAVTLAVEDIVERCRGALGEHTPVLAVRDVLTELVADPAALGGAVGPVELGGITTLHNDGRPHDPARRVDARAWCSIRTTTGCGR